MKNLNIEFVQNGEGQVKSDITIKFVIFEKEKMLRGELSPKEEAFLEFQDFKVDDVLVMQDAPIIFSGLSEMSGNAIAYAMAKAVRALKKLPYKTATFNVEWEAYNVGLGAVLGFYSFSYKTDEKQKGLEKLIITSSKPAGHCLNDGIMVANSVNLAREVVNTMPEVANAAYVAKIAKEVANENGLEIFVGDKDFLAKENFNAFLAVNRASKNDPFLVHLTYKGKSSKPKARVAVVGKGLTYDSGGLSLKPSASLVSMKSDKSGACAALGIIKAASHLGLDVEVHAILGMAENAIGPNAYRPDDVLFTREGKSVEVQNTDAEGRLVLADCLSYAQDLKPDYIIDLATLTGACVVALGDYTTGIMGYNMTLQHKMLTLALNSGELAAILPFNRHLKKLLDSKVADICNIGSSRMGGAMQAGLFLGAFIREEYKDKWIHLDIAGPAFVNEVWDVNPAGASGAGVRMCVEFLKDLEGGQWGCK